jgi:hypothetical protein
MLRVVFTNMNMAVAESTHSPSFSARSAAPRELDVRKERRNPDHQRSTRASR